MSEHDSIMVKEDQNFNRSILRRIVEAILNFKQPEKIVLYGSRAAGEERRTSDIDLAVFAKSWVAADFAEIKDILEEKIPTPLTFDVTDFYRLQKESLKQDILKEGKILYESGKITEGL